MNFVGKLNFGRKKVVPRELFHRKKKINLLVAHGIVNIRYNACKPEEM